MKKIFLVCLFLIVSVVLNAETPVDSVKVRSNPPQLIFGDVGNNMFAIPRMIPHNLNGETVYILLTSSVTSNNNNSNMFDTSGLALAIQINSLITNGIILNDTARLIYLLMNDRFDTRLSEVIAAIQKKYLSDSTDTVNITNNKIDTPLSDLSQRLQAIQNADSGVKVMNQDTRSIIKNFPDTYGVKIQDIYSTKLDTSVLLTGIEQTIDLLQVYNNIMITADSNVLISTNAGGTANGFPVWEKAYVYLMDSQYIYFKNADGINSGRIYISANKK